MMGREGVGGRWWVGGRQRVRTRKLAGAGMKSSKQERMEDKIKKASGQVSEQVSRHACEQISKQEKMGEC